MWLANWRRQPGKFAPPLICGGRRDQEQICSAAYFRGPASRSKIALAVSFRSPRRRQPVARSQNFLCRRKFAGRHAPGPSHFCLGRDPGPAMPVFKIKWVTPVVVNPRPPSPSGLVPASPPRKRGALWRIRHSPSPAQRERVASAARRVRVLPWSASNPT
jgi:hypothetical protein